MPTSETREYTHPFTTAQKTATGLGIISVGAAVLHILLITLGVALMKSLFNVLGEQCHYDKVASTMFTILLFGFAYLVAVDLYVAYLTYNVDHVKNTKIQVALIQDYLFIIILTTIVSGVISFHNCGYRSHWKQYLGFIIPPLVVLVFEGFLFVSRFALSVVTGLLLNNTSESRRGDEGIKLLV